MIKILNQSKKCIYDLANNNIFVSGNKILISAENGFFNSNTAVLGEYNDNKEAEFVFEWLQEWLKDLYDIDKIVWLYDMPQKEERTENNDEGE